MAAIPSLSQISQQQASLYETYFRQVNPSGTGTVGASEAAAFLKKSGLPEGILHTIWDLSDQGSKGYLDKKGFYIALKLISLAQSGNEVSLNGLAIPTSPPRMGESPRGIPPPKQVSKADTTSWGIKAKEKLQYDAIFDGLKPINGLLSGDKVKPVLLNSKLPVDVLGKIWDISDIDQDGSLDRDEFSVAMHLVYRAIDGETVPVTLPLLLVPPSKRKLPISHVVITSVNPAINPPLQQSLTGDKQWIQPSLTGDKQWIQPTLTGDKQWIQPTLTGDKQWVIPAIERTKYHQMFVQADSDKDGLVAGGEIKDVLLASALPQPMLAHIWNLCDKNNTGLLTADQFAFAMHLIAMVKAGKELPKNVSAEMILPPTHSTVAHQPLQTKASNDLSQISLESSSSDFSAIKELDQITTEIEALGREKASLQKEISETEEAIRNRKSEIEDLQNELQKGNKGIELLNQQKAQSQSQLDSLDDEKSRYDEQCKDIHMKIQDEKQILNQLRSQYKSQHESCKEQEVELQRARKELDEVRKEESALELEVENNKKELQSLKDKVARTKSEISQAQSKIDKLSDENNSLKEEIAQYTSSSNNMQNGSNHLTELNENFETRFKDMDQVSARATAGSSPVSSISGFSGSGGVGDDEENDDFKDNDPFKSKDDPFGGNESETIDPFNSDDPFKSDPFKTVSFADDPFSGDPFQDNDPFKSDPFKQIPGSDIKSSKGDGIVSDPFRSLDPFGTGAFVATSSVNSAFPPSGTAKSVESNSSDPFSTGNLFSAPHPSVDDGLSQPEAITNDPFTSDPFASADPFDTPHEDDPFSSTSTATEDPFTVKETGDDPFLSTTSVDPFSSAGADPFTTPVNLTDDPFASAVVPGDDPFLSSNIATSDSNDPWFAFNDVSFPSKTKSKDSENTPPAQTLSSEENQLEWAKRESEREEAARQKRLKELQDQEEMEMAIALKQSVESSSDA